ncbi:phage tail protein [Roseovarius atlanticus]|uniref:phage tail protein n=1 Tax=Roseovarius atlanticus TaxID=1641875 RepID=UPI001C97EBAC|nr:phage tail protein [Roseovarius atlanticus]MBY5988924.1 phage tail protein [Roseovarius atlanticus]MBY6124316.1 phage tail protein [Roseovarius atlanticus]MBY6148811.1 phage tail protein [Roseovarius atlanticus]
MADDTPDQLGWPSRRFSFRVSWDDIEVSFQEVSGLEAGTDVIEYRAGNSKVFSPTGMPGIQKSSNVTLKRGVMTNDQAFRDWVNAARMDTIARKTVTIALADQTGKPTRTWTLRNALHIKISGTDLKADGNEIAIETLELAHEGLEIANGQD